MLKSRINRREFLATTALGGAIAAAGPYRPAEAQTKSLKVRSYIAPERLDPIHYLGAPEADIFDCLYPGLISYKPGKEWGWQLDAATSIEQVDPTHVKFELKKGLGWSGGNGEVTAEDVKFSYERIAKPENKSPYRGDWEALDRVDVTSSHTGVIVLKEPFIPLFSTTLPRAAGNIVCKKAVEKLDGQRFTLEPPATFGAYKIKKIEPRVRFTLERNPGWPGERAMFDEVDFVVVTDANAAETAFATGELDVALLPMTAVPRLRKAMPPKSKLVVSPSLAYWWLGMQMEDGIFKDKRVRQAVQYAVDAQSVLDGAFFGVAERSTGIIAPGMIGHRPANKIAKPDLDRARKLLAEAGHPRGFKTEIGVRNSAEFINVGQVIAAGLAQVGIQAEVAPFDSGVQKAMASDKAGGWKKMQMHVVRFSMAPDPSWATVWFTKEQIGEWNWERFPDAEYNDLHKAALREYDAKKRHDMYVRMQDIMEDSGAYVFLTHGVNPVLHRDHFIPALAPDGNRVYVTKFKST
ncbi:MAG: twin-arginine translocation signal domain-containing protein [Alphaproteobacteria bacterium]|nr:twin-arginine translocation signal domain-containing protein [Alphaproteobacteria bacterium]